MKADLQSVINEIKERILHVYGYDKDLNFIGKRHGIKPIEPKTHLSPKEFLKFASEDIKEPTTEHGVVNCLSNCKRAIDSQLDALIDRLGYLSICRQKRWPFPKKIEFIKNFGILAPRILEKINKLRNKLEHEYKIPSKSDAEDALDISLLFVSYAEMAPLPGLNWGIGGGGGIHVRYNTEDMSFNFFREAKERDESGKRKMVDLNIKVQYGQNEFDDLYQFFTETVPKLKRREKDI
jgi:hypothetical protein